MKLELYREILQDIDNQIEVLQKSRKKLIEQNQKYIKKQIENRKKNEREWFVKNFNMIWNNRHKFSKNTPDADVVIDFFSIYTKGNKAGRKFFHDIEIGDLITLWNLGFKYQGCPIVEYTNLSFSSKIKYIKDEKIKTISGVGEETLGFSPIMHAILEYLCVHATASDGLGEHKTFQVIKDILAN